MIWTWVLSYCNKALYHCSTIRDALDCDLFSFFPCYVRLQLWDLCNKNVHIHLFIYIIFVHKIFSCSKSMMLNKFVIDFFSVSQIVFEIKTLTQNFSARWSCKWFHCVAHGHFTRFRHHFYDCISFRLEIIGVAMDLSRHTVYCSVLFIIISDIFDHGI